MTTQSERKEAPPHRMRCVRRLYVLEDESGRTWLAAEEEVGPPEGGAMSHRTDGGRDMDGDKRGGSMSHVGPGTTAEVEGGDGDQVTVLLPAGSGDEPQRMQAYRVSPALLPDGAAPAST